MVSSESGSRLSAKRRDGPIAWDPRNLLRSGLLQLCVLLFSFTSKPVPASPSAFSGGFPSPSPAAAFEWLSGDSRISLAGGIVLLAFALLAVWVLWKGWRAAGGINRAKELRKKLEEELSKSRATLRISQKIAKIGSWELNLSTLAIEWSEETYRIFGRKCGQFQPNRENFYQSVHEQDRPAVRSAMERAIEHAQPYAVEHRVVLPDGSERVVREQGELIADDGVAKVVGTVQDLTEQKRIEEKLRQVLKMEAVGRLAGGVAHEFNNILTVILGHVDLLLADSAAAAATLESLLQIRSSAERAANLTRELLAFGRRQVMQKKQTDLNEVVESMARMLQPLLGEDVILEVSGALELPPIEADPGMIEQVLVNLAINARDAMPRGGRLTILTRVYRFSETDSSQHPESRPGRFVCLTVTDTGCGMDESTVRRIFEPFFTTKDAGMGSGLGLATIHGIVKQHDGWVEVSSTPNEGSTFTAFFPALDLPSAPPGGDSAKGAIGLSV